MGDQIRRIGSNAAPDTPRHEGRASPGEWPAAKQRRVEQKACYTYENRDLINRIINGLKEL